jgi:hypothetical protein
VGETRRRSRTPWRSCSATRRPSPGPGPLRPPRDCEWYGTLVPAGSKMVPADRLGGARRAALPPNPDPDRFDVDRSFERLVALGYGIHFCLGRRSRGSRDASLSRRRSAASRSGTSTAKARRWCTRAPCAAGQSFPSCFPHRGASGAAPADLGRRHAIDRAGRSDMGGRMRLADKVAIRQPGRGRDRRGHRSRLCSGGRPGRRCRAAREPRRADGAKIRDQGGEALGAHRGRRCPRRRRADRRGRGGPIRAGSTSS